jgi:hypothetical protein
MMTEMSPTASSPDQPQLTCLSCSYDLRGLPIGASCPECGLVVIRQTHKDLPLDHAHTRVVHGVAWRLALSALVFVILFPAALVTLIMTRPELAAPLAFGLSIPVISWLFTKAWNEPGAIINKLGPGDRTCLVTRYAASVWLLYAITTIAAPFIGGSGATLLLLIARICILAGIIQLLMLVIVAGRYALWTRDETADGFIRFISMGLVVIFLGSLAGGLIDLIYGSSSNVLSTVNVLLILGTLVVAILLVARLGFNAAWSILHRHENNDYERRRTEREREKGEVFAARIDRMDE